MARPVLSSAQFPQKLHKKKWHYDPATIFGEHMAAGDTVIVTGTHGHSPTTWNGTIARDNGDGSFAVNNLTVGHEEQFRKIKDKDADAGAGGGEDVSVTVTNTDGTSAPVITNNVPTIP